MGAWHTAIMEEGSVAALREECIRQHEAKVAAEAERDRLREALEKIDAMTADYRESATTGALTSIARITYAALSPATGEVDARSAIPTGRMKWPIPTTTPES